MKLIFDSGSDWLSVEGTQCESCKGTKYDESSSAFFQWMTTLTADRRYGTYMHLQGKTVSDDVCLLAGSVCVSPFSFFYVTDQYGLPSEVVDGILGLTQAGVPDATLQPENDFPTGISFMG